MATELTRIVIADDHPILRDGLRRLLECEPDLRVVGEAPDGSEVGPVVKLCQPDILILDAAMPRMSGIDALRALRKEGCMVRTIVLTVGISQEQSTQFLGLGILGLVRKDSATSALIKCIRAVMHGEHWISRELLVEFAKSASADTAKQYSLTNRELQIIREIENGCTNREIAHHLEISEETVKRHLSNIYDKLGVSNRLELALFSMHHRLLPQQ